MCGYGGLSSASSALPKSALFEVKRQIVGGVAARTNEPVRPSAASEVGEALSLRWEPRRKRRQISGKEVPHVLTRTSGMRRRPRGPRGVVAWPTATNAAFLGRARGSRRRTSSNCARSDPALADNCGCDARRFGRRPQSERSAYNHAIERACPQRQKFFQPVASVAWQVKLLKKQRFYSNTLGGDGSRSGRGLSDRSEQREALRSC